jgi:hypothetical protein
MKRTPLIASVGVALILCSCAALNFIGERLNVFLVNFSFGGIGIGIVTPPNLISMRLSDYGIAVNCRINAKNDNAGRAAFDGAVFRLQIDDTARAARGIEASVPSFNVEAGSQTSFTVPFKIMLDNPLFSKAILRKVVFGDRIPYRVSADLLFSLVASNPGGGRGVAAFGTKSMTIDLVSDAVDTRPDLGSFSGKAFMAALNLLSKK